jgi:hypothetical protein
MPLPPDARSGHPALRSLCAASLRHPSALTGTAGSMGTGNPSQPSVKHSNDVHLVIAE